MDSRLTGGLGSAEESKRQWRSTGRVSGESERERTSFSRSETAIW